MIYLFLMAPSSTMPCNGGYAGGYARVRREANSNNPSPAAPSPPSPLPQPPPPPQSDHSPPSGIRSPDLDDITEINFDHEINVFYDDNNNNRSPRIVLNNNNNASPRPQVIIHPPSANSSPAQPSNDTPSPSNNNNYYGPQPGAPVHASSGIGSSSADPFRPSGKVPKNRRTGLELAETRAAAAAVTRDLPAAGRVRKAPDRLSNTEPLRDHKGARKKKR